jgi:hypothetical protein
MARMSKLTKGLNQQAFIAKNIGETDDATYAAFVANAPVGEIGIFDGASTLAKHNNLITSTEKFFIAQKHTGGVKKTAMFNFKDIKASRKVAYTAPVKCAYFLGWNGSGYSMNLAAVPAADKVYEFGVIELTEGNQPFPTWSYNHTAKPNQAEIDVVLALVKQVNDVDNTIYKNRTRLVEAKALCNATYTNYAIAAGGTLAFTKGSATAVIAVGALTIAAGEYIAVTTGSGALTNATLTNVYKVLATDTTTYLTLDRPFEEANMSLVEAAVEGGATAGGSIKKAATFVATGIKLTALNDDEHFKVVRREELENADINFSAFTMGNGTPSQISNLEFEGTNFDGETTKGAEYAADYGVTDRFVDAAGAYQLYHIEMGLDSDSKAGWGVGKVGMTLTVAAHNSNAAFKTYMDTLFGL